MRVLSRVEQDKLCRYISAHPDGYTLGILVCLFMGLRVGEICALRWEDISFEEQTIYVHQTMQRIQNVSGEGAKTRILISSPKSPCSNRIIPIPDKLLPLLQTYQRASSGFFLTNSCKKFVEPRLMQQHFGEVLALSGIAPANFHALRHTFATRCVELGVDVKSLSEILGHSNVTITLNRYVHPSMELKKENMNRLSVLF
jgi:integrase